MHKVIHQTKLLVFLGTSKWEVRQDSTTASTGFNRSLETQHKSTKKNKYLIPNNTHHISVISAKNSSQPFVQVTSQLTPRCVNVGSSNIWYGPKLPVCQFKSGHQSIHQGFSTQRELRDFWTIKSAYAVGITASRLISVVGEGGMLEN